MTYHKRISLGRNCLMRGFEVDDNGIIVYSWTFERLGNDEFHDENDAIPYIGKPISSEPDAYKVSAVTA